MRSTRLVPSSRGAFLTLLVLLPACQTARMPVPETLAASERMPVQGRQGWKLNQQIRFGPFETSEVQRSWTRGRDLRVLAYERNNRRQQYSFTLREAAQDRWRVTCAATLLARTIHTPVVDVEPTNRSALHCSLRSLEGSGEVWELMLHEQRERPLAGTLTRDGATLRVLGTNRLDRALSTSATTGYEIQENGRVLGAVEVINDGAVWLRGDVAPGSRSLVSATSAALLLLEDLRETLES